MSQYSNDFCPIEEAIEAIAKGQMVILVDDDDRENEGDLILAADHVTPEAINFMAKHARGLICLTLSEEIVDRIGLRMMVQDNHSSHKTAFTVSIEAAKGVTTGISAADRSHTVKVAVSLNATAKDIVSPGHIFPLKAKPGGVMVRAGHTEGSVDLATLAGCQAAAVICEVMNDDGTMARFDDLKAFSQAHDLKLVNMNDLIAYRMAHECLVDELASSRLPVHDLGEFTIKVFKSRFDNVEHTALIKGEIDPNKPTLVRVHSACQTGDIFGSMRCDCGEQLNAAMKQIAAEGGVLLYMPQEGRGIGLANKIKAYTLQDEGLDTVEANHKLGFHADHRDYGVGSQILRYLGIKQMRLLTNNPRKIYGLDGYGLEIAERVPLHFEANENNVRYLQTKKEKLGHMFGDDD